MSANGTHWRRVYADIMGKKTDPPVTTRKEVAEPTEGTDPSEFEEFVRLAGRLVKVPKRELDAERAKANGKNPKP
jgi:hypothetical protein